MFTSVAQLFHLTDPVVRTRFPFRVCSARTPSSPKASRVASWRATEESSVQPKAAIPRVTGHVPRLGAALISRVRGKEHDHHVVPGKDRTQRWSSGAQNYFEWTRFFHFVLTTSAPDMRPAAPKRAVSYGTSYLCHPCRAVRAASPGHEPPRFSLAAEAARRAGEALRSSSRSSWSSTTRAPWALWSPRDPRALASFKWASEMAPEIGKRRDETRRDRLGVRAGQQGAPSGLPWMGGWAWGRWA